jgi:hypothetical protein
MSDVVHLLKPNLRFVVFLAHATILPAQSIKDMFCCTPSGRGVGQARMKPKQAKLKGHATKTSSKGYAIFSNET